MLDYKKKSIVLCHGVFKPGVLKTLKFLAKDHVFVCEGRPDLEAGRSGVAQLLKMGITPTVISDNMAGFLFFKGLVKKVVLAVQYVDDEGALGDMGALIMAVLARKHQVPLKLLAAQQRHRFLGDPKAILSFEGQRMAPAATHGYVPLVEWVPFKYLKK